MKAVIFFFSGNVTDHQLTSTNQIKATIIQTTGVIYFITVKPGSTLAVREIPTKKYIKSTTLFTCLKEPLVKHPYYQNTVVG